MLIESIKNWFKKDNKENIFLKGKPYEEPVIVLTNRKILEAYMTSSSDEWAAYCADLLETYPYTMKGN